MVDLHSACIVLTFFVAMRRDSDARMPPAHGLHNPASHAKLAKGLTPLGISIAAKAPVRCEARKRILGRRNPINSGFCAPAEPAAAASPLPKISFLLIRPPPPYLLAARNTATNRIVLNSLKTKARAPAKSQQNSKLKCPFSCRKLKNKGDAYAQI
jgi:hypothetical protein